MRKLRIAISIALIFAFSNIQRSSASWYSGSNLSNVYGAWAYISTPANPIHVVQADYSEVDNWVSTSGPNWIQAGWDFRSEMSIPKQYVEYCLNSCLFQSDYVLNDTFATQSWGTTVDYLIEWIPGTITQWCAYTNGIQRNCVEVRNAPSDVQVKSEVHVSPFNQLDTTFNPVRYKGSDMVWREFNQNSFSWNFPYQTQVFSNSNFRNYRVDTYEIYLPHVVNE